MFSIVILSYNSEDVLRETLQAAVRISNDVHVVDSHSTDGTLAIVRAFPVNLVQRPFENYAAQRNWAGQNLPLRHPWVLHLDADERPDELLERSLLELRLDEASVEGFFINRITVFMGRRLVHGGLNPQWHMRLFRRDKGRCEDRLYDQHFFVTGPTASLRGNLVDDQRMSISEWVARHNRWADMEADEVMRGREDGQIRPDARGNPVERKRFQKSLYYRLPLFIRPIAFYLYRYILRGGFLDGREGLIYFFLQSLWFRFLVDAKIFERRRGADRP